MISEVLDLQEEEDRDHDYILAYYPFHVRCEKSFGIVHDCWR